MAYTLPGRHQAIICTVECGYNVVQYNMVLHTSLQEVRQNINQWLNPQMTSHTPPYGMSFVNILEKIDCVIPRLQCIFKNIGTGVVNCLCYHEIVIKFDVYFSSCQFYFIVLPCHAIVVSGEIGYMSGVIYRADSRFAPSNERWHYFVMTSLIGWGQI